MSQGLLPNDSSSARTLRSIDMSSLPPAPPPPPSDRDGSAAGPPNKKKWAGPDEPNQNVDGRSPTAAGPEIDSDQETMGSDAPAAPQGSAPANPPQQNPAKQKATGQTPTGRADLATQGATSPGRPNPVLGGAAPKKTPAAGGKTIPPPPPPPRSTLPPVRPISEPTSPKSGIGSANTRWRGSLPEISVDEPKSEENDQDQTVQAAEDEQDETVEAVTKSAPSWLLSLVLHLIVLLILALISTPTGSGLTNLVLNFGISEDSVDDAVELDLSSVLTDLQDESFEETTDPTELEADLPDVLEMITPEETEALDELLGAEKIEIAKPMFTGRTGAMRKALEAMFGATDDTRNAVKLGLAWLKRQQHRSGYWSMRGPYENGAISENKPAATAMALLAFAGDGNTHLEGMYRSEVDKGLKYLISQQDRGGFMASAARGNERTYAQAQATIALCELYGMTKDSWLRGYAQLAVDYAIKAQASNGGWRYRPNEPGDTSVTGWYVMALQSAAGAGLDVPKEKLSLVESYLDSVSVYGGAGYTYQPGRTDATPTMTAEGLLCRQYLGWKHDHPMMFEGLNELRLQWPFDLSNHNVYYWYYATQVFHHYGGPMWREWNDQMKVKLPALQIKEGNDRGSWAPQDDRWSIGGRLYTTCLSIYCLEVYYRHMPIYDLKH